MQNEVSPVTLLHWSVWTPESEESSKSPSVVFVQPLLRRRMSRLSRMVAHVAFQCCEGAGVAPDSVHLIFSSYHGELLSTVGILKQIESGEPVSPTDFTISVHHSPIALFSLIAKNRRIARAIGGGEESFCYGFLDALGLLSQGSDPVLFIVGDDRPPVPFSSHVTQPSQPFAAAFLMKKDPIPGKPRISLKMDNLFKSGETQKSFSNRTPPLDFVHWLSTNESQWGVHSEKRRWVWTRYPQS